jgi:hypothetical protein
MRSAETVLGRLADRRHSESGRTMHTPKSFSTKPVAFAPHPPLVSGGWYNGSDQEIAGPGRYPVPRPKDKTAGSALLWTFFFGPLGLCYLSVNAGVAATALTAAALILSGSAIALAVIWPIVMLLSVLHTTGRP